MIITSFVRIVYPPKYPSNVCISNLAMAHVAVALYPSIVYLSYLDTSL